MNYIMVESTNGQGYSEPTFKVVNDENKAMFITQAMLGYGGMKVKVTQINPLKTQIEYGHDETESYADCGMVELLPIKNENDWYIVCLLPDVNDAQICFCYDTCDDAQEQLSRIVNDNILNHDFEEDDVKEYESDNMSFGSHDNEIGYVCYQIIGGAL